jgi:glycosyltransferase involved in cell wall biosynthesis
MVSQRDSLIQFLDSVRQDPLRGWDDISVLLSNSSDFRIASQPHTREELLQSFAKGIAIVTFEYGIDGVSVEVAKYARALETIFSQYSGAAIHLIGDEFYPQADTLFRSRWRRYQIQGANGWSKWDHGKWFSALFREDMPAESEISASLAAEMFNQALVISKKLGTYIIDNHISLLIPVNAMSNPGNLAFTLALVLVSELLGLYVINSNHDFYWEGGKPAAEKRPGEPHGVRDHFFRNVLNTPFFQLFQSLYPWNGKRWLQVNINSLQSTRLITQFSFRKDQVYRLPTSVGDGLFDVYTQNDVKSARLRMAYILSDGEPNSRSTRIHQHFQNLGRWMQNQKPVILGTNADFSFDPVSDDLIYLLQPTRIIARKRIEKDVELIGALLEKGALREEFETNENRQLVLHITGPTPIEHQADLETILQAFIKLIEALPASIANRIFLAFSVGFEDHPSLKANSLEPMGIIDIYRMATAVLFPSETEGRGLPIIETSAIGVPIICSRYQPEKVFAEVVGEGLPEEQQIRYTLFPEGEFTSAFLDEVAELLLQPEKSDERRKHNQEAVGQRFSKDALINKFEQLLEHLQTLP